MLPFTNSKIWLYPQPIDFRKQIDGLVILLASQLDQEPNSGQVFIFRSKRSD
ncbi:MAG: IS66 family insertion sequence element accessory protein TnpB, partial [Candidatus Brocadiales bacterium]|nr:IS66 family insertion sequence element accessory protein TnpB [Candidatus Brocadiales bacterium]